MVPFAGWEMPVQYEGVIPEHRAVRNDCGVFDVSHMGQFHVEGPNAHELLQSLLSNDLDKIGDGEAQYTLLTNERGGIVDDLIAYRIGRHHYLVVVNAGNRDAAYAWMKEREIRGSEVRDASDEYALLAVQGPRSIERLGLPEAKPFTHAMGEIDGVEVMVNRTGYTGEQGVELMCAAEDAEALWDAVVARGAVPCGLGARDTLRLEVCYPLHGNDITQDTDPISAGLGWTCALGKEFTGAERDPRDQGGRAGAQARRVRDGGEGGPAPGDADHLLATQPAARSRPARTRRCSTRGSAWATSRPTRRAPATSSRSTCAARSAAPPSSRNRSTSERNNCTWPQPRATPRG